MFGKFKEKKLKQETINLTYGHLLFIFKPVPGKKKTDLWWKLKLLNQLEPKIKYSLVIKNLKSMQIIQQHFEDMQLSSKCFIDALVDDLGISNLDIAQYIVTEIGQIGIRLLYAVKAESIEKVKLLLEDMHVNPTINDNVALRCAAQNYRHEIVKLLLSDSRVCEQSEPQFVMEWAIRNEYDEIVQYLLYEDYVGSVAHNNTLVNLRVFI